MCQRWIDAGERSGLLTHIGDQIDTAMVFARSDFVSVQHPVSAIEPSITTSKTNGIVIFISGNVGLTCGKRLRSANCAESFGI